MPLSGPRAVLVERLDRSGKSLRLDAGSIAIGTSGECELSVEQGCGVEPCHVRIALDSRGLVLEVGAGCERVHVNARPVRERALLRVGDMISIGTSKWLLKQEGALSEWTPKPSSRRGGGGNSLVALRAVAGPLSGRRLVLAPSLIVDDNILTGVRGTLELGQDGSDVGFRYRGEAGTAPRANGIQTASGLLQPGAQLAWGPHRLVLEAPGVMPEADRAPGRQPAPGPEPERAAEGEPPEKVAGPSNEVWWLIATAAVLALGIAVLLIWTA